MKEREITMQEIVVELEQQGLPGELQRLKLALLTDQNGMLTAARLRLARIAQARGVDTNAIDDVVQETLLEAWSHLGRLSSPAGFHAWIDEICRNVCRRYARSRQANLLRYVPFSGSYQDNESTPAEDDASPFANIPDPSAPDPLETLSRQELELLLDRALGLLPEEARQVLEMCHLLDMPHSEVAERLGIPVGALYTRLHRARRHLRQVLSGPLRREAAAFDLALEQEDNGGWFDTRTWCSCCGRYRLQGSFFETELVLLALHKGHRPCPWCGNLSVIQVADAETEEDDTPRLGPYRYWVRWSCAHCGGLVCSPGDIPSVDQVVYWSHQGAHQFMAQHPHWLSTPGIPLEYAGQPALSFQLTDTGSAESLTVLAHRHTLRLLNT